VGRSRCPLDQHFLHQRCCCGCGSELFPRELYCADCGLLNREPEEALLLPREAGARRILASLLLDYLSVGLLAMLALSGLIGSYSLIFVPLLGVLYRGLGRSGGRQSLGQAVFHVLTVSEVAGPVALEEGLRRSVLELWLGPKLLTGGARVISELERRTRTLEVYLA